MQHTLCSSVIWFSKQFFYIMTIAFMILPPFIGLKNSEMKYFISHSVLVSQGFYNKENKTVWLK